MVVCEVDGVGVAAQEIIYVAVGRIALEEANHMKQVRTIP